MVRSRGSLTTEWSDGYSGQHAWSMRLSFGTENHRAGSNGAGRVRVNCCSCYEVSRTRISTWRSYPDNTPRRRPFERLRLPEFGQGRTAFDSARVKLSAPELCQVALGNSRPGDAEMKEGNSTSDVGTSPVESNVASGLVQNLAQFGNPYLLANGLVCVISLEAISQRLGDRWPQRRDIVHAYLTRLIERDIDPNGLTEWLSETSVIIVQPDRPPIAGQAACLKILKQTLQHFLGDSNTEDTIVHTVTRITGGEVFGLQLDVEQVIAAAVSLAVATTPPPDQWSPFIASNGRRVRVSCRLEPLMLLKTSARIGYRISRRIVETPSDIALTDLEVSNLSRADAFNIDAASIARGLQRLSSDVSGEVAPTLIVPVSYSTLAHSPSLTKFLGLLASASNQVKLGLVCEIVDFESAPLAQIETTLSQLRHHCAHVIGRHHPKMNLGTLPSGITGLGVEVPAIEGDAEFVGWMRTVQASTKSHRAALLLFQLQNPRQLALATAMGATHATLQPLRASNG